MNLFRPKVNQGKVNKFFFFWKRVGVRILSLAIEMAQWVNVLLLVAEPMTCDQFPGPTLKMVCPLTFRCTKALASHIHNSFY